MDINNQVNANSKPVEELTPTTSETQQTEVSAENQKTTNSEIVTESPDVTAQVPVNPRPQKKNIVLLVGILFFIISVIVTGYFLFLKDFIAKSIKL